MGSQSINHVKLWKTLYNYGCNGYKISNKVNNKVPECILDDNIPNCDSISTKISLDDSICVINNNGNIFVLYKKFNVSPSYQIDPDINFQSLLSPKYLFESNVIFMSKQKSNFDYEFNNNIMLFKK